MDPQMRLSNSNITAAVVARGAGPAATVTVRASTRLHHPVDPGRRHEADHDGKADAIHYIPAPCRLVTLWAKVGPAIPTAAPVAGRVGRAYGCRTSGTRQGGRPSAVLPVTSSGGSRYGGGNAPDEGRGLTVPIDADGHADDAVGRGRFFVVHADGPVPLVGL